MNKLHLDTALVQACEDLQWITEAFAKIGSKGTLSQESKSFFQLSSGFHVQLEHAKELIPIRNVALQAVKAFPNQVSAKNPGLFVYNGQEVTFKTGRFLSLQNYAVTTWALYDSLSKVAGILCSIDELSKNATKPMKLYEDFLQSAKNGVGGRMRDHLIGGYGWPIVVSYKIRNWLAHDGHCQDGIEMFKYESAAPSSEFEMLDSAWDIIEKKCQPHTTTRTRRSPFPDVKTNLVNGLEICHEEVDEAMGFVLTWSTGIIKLQASILLPRDS